MATDCSTSDLSSIVLETRRLANRMRERDETFNIFFEKGKVIKQYLASKSECLEDTMSLEALAEHVSNWKYKTHDLYTLSIATENKQFEQLLQENRTLQATIDEQCSVLEIVMDSYRKQMQLIKHIREDEAKFFSVIRKMDTSITSPTNYEILSSFRHFRLSPLVFSLLELLEKMRKCMVNALQAADATYMEMSDRIAYLREENEDLREVLRINCDEEDDSHKPSSPTSVGSKAETHEQSSPSTFAKGLQDISTAPP